MQDHYALEWLDDIITISLNPDKTNLQNINAAQSEKIKSLVKEEKLKYRAFLQQLVFSLLDEAKIEILIKHYYATLVLLLDKTWHYSDPAFDNNSHLKEVKLLLIESLEELLSFIEYRYPDYLDADQRAAVNLLQVTKNELKTHIETLKSILEQVDIEFAAIIIASFDGFFEKIDKDVEISIREVLYMKELAKRLEQLVTYQNNALDLSTCNALLICMNFNNKAFTDYFVNLVNQKLLVKNDALSKLDILLLYRKQLSQINCKASTAFNPQEKDAKSIIIDWLQQEMIYCEKKIELGDLPQSVSGLKHAKSEPRRFKIHCTLSVDQLGLILRAADETRLITARSLNALFKGVTPYLSTDHKTNISADSMRSKSYVAETKDKTVAIEALEQLIEKINDY